MRDVIKIGGSVFVDSKSYDKQAANIEQLWEKYRPRQLVIVVSAAQGSTDAHIACMDDEDEPRLRRALRGDCIYSEADRPYAADFLIQGEIDSAKELARRIPGANLLTQDHWSYPVRANTGYLAAELDQLGTRHNFASFDNLEGIIVAAGYGARNHHGEKVLMGRNASDLLAAIFARYMQADRLIFLKDVDGVYDNFGTPEQLKRNHITFDEARNVGKILYPPVMDQLVHHVPKVMIGHYDDLLKLYAGNRGIGTTIH